MVVVHSEINHFRNAIASKKGMKNIRISISDVIMVT